MNAVKRNNILIDSLQEEDLNDDTYILPGDHPTFRVAYDESEWLDGKKVRKAHIEWTHEDEYSTVKCNPVLSPVRTWTIKNCDCPDLFRSRCDQVFGQLSAYIRKDYE